ANAFQTSARGAGATMESCITLSPFGSVKEVFSTPGKSFQLGAATAGRASSIAAASTTVIRDFMGDSLARAMSAAGRPCVLRDARFAGPQDDELCAAQPT